jgi:hypothetical protein
VLDHLLVLDLEVKELVQQSLGFEPDCLPVRTRYHGCQRIADAALVPDFDIAAIFEHLRSHLLDGQLHNENSLLQYVSHLSVSLHLLEDPD